MRSNSRHVAALIAGAAIASALLAQGAAASTPRNAQSPPPGQAGVVADAFAPTAIDPASEQAPDGVSPRSHTFRHCGNRRVCIFGGANYRIWKFTFGASYAGVWRWIYVTSGGVPLRHYSAKIRFDDRRLVLRGPRANGTWRRFCLNPNTNRPGPLGPGMLQFKIGAVGSRC